MHASWEGGKRVEQMVTQVHTAGAEGQQGARENTGRLARTPGHTVVLREQGKQLSSPPVPVVLDSILRPAGKWRGEELERRRREACTGYNV